MMNLRLGNVFPTFFSQCACSLFPAIERLSYLMVVFLGYYLGRDTIKELKECGLSSASYSEHFR